MSLTSLTEKVKAHTNYLEALGIIEDWQSKTDEENTQLTRLAELILAFLNRHQDLMIELSDLEIMNSLIRREKNNEILRLKELIK
tara:strand:- start:889 stop:1143 length:255 start_codon:yes stop_codon:yes gene_type:complete